MLNRKIAVVLSGCGFMDGSEIHESVLTLLALSKRGVTYQCFAPDIPQTQVINHLEGKTVDEQRNVLVEAARIARGAVKALESLRVENFDGVVFPGGYGVVKNLSDFESAGADCSVQESVARTITAFHKAHKPIAALCISPVLLAKVLGGGLLTVGQDAEVGETLRTLGATVQNTTHGEAVVDTDLKLITTPCYMLEASVAQIAAGADKAVEALLKLI